MTLAPTIAFQGGTIMHRALGLLIILALFIVVAAALLAVGGHLPPGVAEDLLRVLEHVRP